MIPLVSGVTPTNLITGFIFLFILAIFFVFAIYIFDGFLKKRKLENKGNLALLIPVLLAVVFFAVYFFLKINH